MALKKFSTKEVWDKKIKLLLTKLENKHNFSSDLTAYELVINRLQSQCKIYSATFKELVKEKYGESNRENDNEESLLAEILTKYNLIKILISIGSGPFWWKSEWSVYKEYEPINFQNISKWISECFPEYQIDFSMEWPEYKKAGYHTVKENIKKTKPRIQEIFEDIFKHFASNSQLKGAIQDLYIDLIGEKPVNMEELKSDNKTDNSIYKKIYWLIRECANNIPTKGHKGNSKLEVRSLLYAIAHWASVMYKLKEIYKKEKK